MKRLAVIGLLLCSLTAVAAADKHVTVRGTVVTGIVTAGGECPHTYWLRAESPVQGENLIALEPNSRTLIKQLNHRVELEGDAKPCGGVETHHVVLHVTKVTALPDGAEKDNAMASSSSTGSNQSEKKCGEWKAWHDFMPGHPPTLHVTGECNFPSAGYKVELKPRVPQGINPTIYIMDLVITPGMGAQVPTRVPVHYTEKTKAKYTTINIQPDGVDVPVKVTQ